MQVAQINQQLMHKIKKWISKSFLLIWEGILQNLGWFLVVFLISGGYLVIVNTLDSAQEEINRIPTVIIFTPLVLLIALNIILIRIWLKQRLRIKQFTNLRNTDYLEYDFISHYGVYWKIYAGAEFVEDFPYCSCCNPRMKLIQTEWFPHESYICSKSEKTYKLYDEIPQKRQEILNFLYKAYIVGMGKSFASYLNKDIERIKELYPKINEKELLVKIFNDTIISKIPKKLKDELQNRYTSVNDLIRFFEKHYNRYRKYLQTKIEIVENN